MALQTLTAKDYRTEVHANWCIGCGDYGILNAIQLALAERYKSMGNDGVAYKNALAANEEAELLDDLDLRRKISEFLLNEAKHT